MMTSPATRSGNAGATFKAIARLVRGPRHTSVISPGLLRASRTIAAGPLSAPVSRRLGSSPASPRPSSPWNWAAVTNCRASGRLAPRYTGTSLAPNQSRTVTVLGVVWSIPTLPATVVAATSSISGSSTASPNARASSIPVSTSKMTGIGGGMV